MEPGLTRSQVRSARPQQALSDQRAQLRLDRPQAFTFDTERFGAQTVDVLTAFLTGAECPYTCVFCDLWQHTLLGSTPGGALVDQLRWLAHASQVSDEASPVSVLKLYNASNFFDQRAVPESDDEAIWASLEDLPLAAGARVVVECHPKIVLSPRGQARLKAAAESLAAHGKVLEVAFGLETVAEGGLERLHKGASLEEFERAFEQTLSVGALVRAFVLYGIPTQSEKSVDRDEQAQQRRQVDWTLRTLCWAKQRGAQSASVIPVRGGNGTLDRLLELGQWRRPTLQGLLSVFTQALGLQSETPLFDVHLDTWDLEHVDPGGLDLEKAGAVRDHLVELNRTGVVVG